MEIPAIQKKKQKKSNKQGTANIFASLVMYKYKLPNIQ